MAAVPVPIPIPVTTDDSEQPLLLYCNSDGEALLSVAAAAAADNGAMRLIFLDVDGVLNRNEFTKPGAEGEGAHLLPECMICLRDALVQTGGKVVLSSTWRSSNEQRAAIVEALEGMVPGCVVGQTPQDASYRNDMRPSEIATFLQLPEVAVAMDRAGSGWCAVDDMNLVRQAEALASKKGQAAQAAVKWLLPSLVHCFVMTDKAVGLDAAGASNIIQMLTTSLAPGPGPAVAASSGSAVSARARAGAGAGKQSGRSRMK